MPIKPFLFIVLLLLMTAANIKKQFTPLSSKLHNSCQQQAHKNKAHKSEVAAIVCGAPIKKTKAKNLFTTNGLIHIFVVSGAHLNFYKKVLRLILPLWSAKFIINIFLLLYTLTCMFSAPILRAFIQQMSSDLNQITKLNLDTYTVLLLTAALAVIIVPSYLKTISLPMSWVAALCMGQKKCVAKTLVVFLCLFPILLTFTEPSPLSAFSSFFISGAISIFILPLNLLVFIFPYLSFLSDIFYDFLYQALELTSNSISINHSSRSLFSSSYVCWVYALTLNLALILKNRFKDKSQL